MSWIIQGSSHCNNIRQPESFTLTEFNQNSLSAFQRTVTKCLNNSQAILPIYIDSYGGNVDSMCGFLSIIDYGRDKGLKFSTIVNSKAMSAGALTFLYGDENLRFMGGSAKLMLHSAGTFTGGKLPEIKESIETYHREQDTLFEKISKHVKKPKLWLKKNLEKRKDYDWTLSADEVVEEKLGLKYSPTFVFSVEEKFAIV